MPKGHYPPYQANEIVCAFESNDPDALFSRYGGSLADMRNISGGNKLIMMEIVGFLGRMEVDRSQIGWPESRAIFGAISLKQLRIVAEALVQNDQGGRVILGPLQFISSRQETENINTEKIHDDLSAQGRNLLELIVQHAANQVFVPGDPSTYLGYKDCCVDLDVAPAHADLPWGRLLQQHGLNDLNEWTKRHNLPKITGLIVNQTGERQYWPGGDYFESNGRQDMDGAWWADQAQMAVKHDWQPYL